MKSSIMMIHKGVFECRVGFDGVSGFERKAEASLIRLDMRLLALPTASVGKEGEERRNYARSNHVAVMVMKWDHDK